MALASLVFNVNKVEVSDDGTTWVDVGATKGGATFTQGIETLDINDDQNSDPQASIPMSAPKTVKLNLLDAKPSNIALAFNGTVASNTVSIPAVVTGVVKQVKITTQAVNSSQYEVLIKKGFITGESEIPLSNSDAVVIPITVEVLDSGDGYPVVITKLV